MNDRLAPKVRLLGIEIDNVTFQEAVEALLDRLLPGGGRGHYVVTPNVAQIVRLQKDKGLRRIYQNADLVIADGMPVIWLSRLLGTPLKERVTGSDLLPKLCAEAAQRGLRVFFLGARPGVGERAAAQLKREHPQLQVVGVYAPPFGFEHDPQENARIRKLIRQRRPDLLFVALGFPKQERWIAQHAKACRVPLSLGVGAALDFVAGTRKRAPRWMQAWGLEWLFRTLQEPCRLGRRYLVVGPQFLLLALRELWCRKTGR